MKKILSRYFRDEAGFTIIELMIVVAIVAVLAGIAVPSYISSVRRSYLSEVTSAFAAIKNAEESYFSNNGCYVNAVVWPTTVPSGGISTPWDTAPAVWGSSGLNVRPDRQVRFQYEVYASNAYTAGGCGAVIARPTTVGCVADVSASLIPTTVFQTNWYLIVARGDLDSDGTTSNIISAIDDSSVIMCDELE